MRCVKGVFNDGSGGELNLGGFEEFEGIGDGEGDEGMEGGGAGEGIARFFMNTGSRGSSDELNVTGALMGREEERLVSLCIGCC